MKEVSAGTLVTLGGRLYLASGASDIAEANRRVGLPGADDRAETLGDLVGMVTDSGLA